MKKVVELENRWKAYKYKNAIFYLFIALLVAFVALLAFFIKMQVFDKPHTKTAQNLQVTAESSVISSPKLLDSALDSANKLDSALDSAKKVDSAKIAESTPKEQISQQNKITFICRQVITDKLTVRKSASFKSTALGYYPQNSIFCISESSNGLVKTQNGWVSASDKFSQIVDVNMFVDTGFYKYQNIAHAKPSPKTSIEEVKVFDKPINSAKIAESSAFAESKEPPKPPKQKLVITSSQITKEQVIEFKKADFRNSKDYATAIEVARYYYDTKDYENSIKWALNASSSNSKGKQKTESWIIYAKSLYLSGKQEQAIAVLDRYISSTNSKDAIDVLNKMKQGII